MAKKRERLEIIADMLDAISSNEGIGPTRLIYSSNLSPKMFKDYLSEIIESGLAEEKVRTGRKAYALTEKGFRFLERYRIFRDFIEKLGL